MMKWLGQLLGIDNLNELSGGRISFAAPWVQDNGWLLMVLLAAVAILSGLYYLCFQGGQWSKTSHLRHELMFFVRD